MFLTGQRLVSLQLSLQRVSHSVSLVSGPKSPYSQEESLKSRSCAKESEHFLRFYWLVLLTQGVAELLEKGGPARSEGGFRDFKAAGCLLPSGGSQ